MTNPDKDKQLLSEEQSRQALDSLDKSAASALDDVTDRVRKLSLTGIAIVWLFKEGSLHVIVLHPLLLWALTVLVAALVLDFLQAAFSALGWWLEIERLVGKDTFDASEKPASWVLEDVRLPYRVYRRPKTTWPIILLKSVAVAIAYGLIGWYLARRLLGA